METTIMKVLNPLASLTGLLSIALTGCSGEHFPTASPSLSRAFVSTQEPEEPRRFSDWSAPVNLGPPVNSSFIEQGPFISKDGLSLYFHCGDCPSNIGGADIWVAKRASTQDPWGDPVNLGATVNTASNEQGPTLSPDEHLMYFASNRPGGAGGMDLWVSRRRDKRNDFGWEAPQNLGTGVNSVTDEGQAAPFAGEDDNSDRESTILYFSRGPAGGTDIYASYRGRDGTFGNAEPVAELNTAFVDRQPAIRRDGLELFLASDRPGTFGALDLWVSTRRSTNDPWSTPINLGPTVNSTVVDARPALSSHATELYFQSPRAGGRGGFDIWTTTRSKLRDSEKRADNERLSPIP